MLSEKQTRFKLTHICTIPFLGDPGIWSTPLLWSVILSLPDSVSVVDVVLLIPTELAATVGEVVVLMPSEMAAAVGEFVLLIPSELAETVDVEMLSRVATH